MRKYATVICILIGSVFAFGQEQSQKQIDWRTFAQLGEEFTVEVPIFPKSFSQSLDNSTRRYYRLFDKTYYFIFVDSFQKPISKFSGQHKEVMKFVNQFKQSGEKGNFGQFFGEKFEFIDDEGFYHIVVTVKTVSHIYAFQTVSHDKNDRVARHFFSSLKVADNKFEADENKISADSVSNNPIAEIKNQDIELEKESVAKTEAAAIQQSTPINILTKPRANYSDFARFYSIEGTVTARVTFSADGNIGNVNIVSKLPFGLTKNTIKAIKSIQFKPPTKDGIPYSTVKQLKYSFSFF